MISLLTRRAVLAVIGIAATTVAAAAEDIPTIRFGRGTAAEENVWLMLAKPELAPNLGKAYKIEWSQWRASDTMFKAYEAGEIDLVNTSANASLAAAAKGLDFKIVASISRESENGAHTYFLVKANGPKSIAELKGTTVGIVGYRTSIELWAREGLKTGGLDPNRDVKWAVVPFSVMAEAIRTGKISAGGIPEMFAKGEIAKGDLKVLFTSKTGVPFDEELITTIANPKFLQAHRPAVRAFMSDLVVVTKHYLSNIKESRQAIMDAKLVSLPPAIYLNWTEYVRDPQLRPSVEILSKMQDKLVAAGFQETKVDINKLVDLSFTAP